VSRRLNALLILIHVNGEKMGLRWWRDVLIRNQTKRYLDDR
jgi:hypothetical protein